MDLAELCRERQSVAEELALVKVIVHFDDVIVKLDQLYYDMNQVIITVVGIGFWLER